MKILKKENRIAVTIICITLILSILCGLAACSKGNGLLLSVNANDLMEGINSNNVSEKSSDDKFVSAMAQFSLSLFKESASDEKNTLISPLSVMLALAMTANGAKGDTLSEMEEVLGGLSIDELNEYLHTYVKALPSTDKSKLGIANSIWFRANDRLTVNRSFLQTNADYYGAAAYGADFDDILTVTDINNWVSNNTDGMIDKIIDEIPKEAVMYLINALVFDAEWQTIYNKHSVFEGEFTSAGGNKQTVEFMASEESKYISDEKATGFIKDYAGGYYSFAALLPNEGVTVGEYIDWLNGDRLMDTISSAKMSGVSAYLPKFSYDFSLNMNDILQTMGMPLAFDGGKADFSGLGQSTGGNIFISNVVHKTYIAVDERGTKAGAVTSVEMIDVSAPANMVRLDRPFLYMIIDNQTGLPVFIGTVLNIENS